MPCGVPVAPPPFVDAVSLRVSALSCIAEFLSSAGLAVFAVPVRAPGPAVTDGIFGITTGACGITGAVGATVGADGVEGAFGGATTGPSGPPGPAASAG